MAIQTNKDKPGTSREYETIFILRPDTANDAIATLNTRLKGIVETMGGKILKADNWGKRKLAYEIKKQMKGIYLYWQYLATPGTVEELERNLRMLDNVIRYQSVKIDSDVDPTARPSEVSDETWAKAATTAADEEEIMTGQSASRSPYDDDDDIDPDAEEEALQAAGGDDDEKKDQE